jgi:hypothetical protein
MFTCLFQQHPTFNYIDGMLQSFIGPFAFSINWVATINTSFYSFGFAKEGGTFSLFFVTSPTSHFTSYKAHLASS